MPIFALMWRHSALLFSLCILSDLINAATNLALIVHVSNAMRNPANASDNWQRFVLFTIVVMGTSVLSGALVNRVVSRCTLSMRQALLRAIFASPLRTVEDAGAPRLLVTLGEDIGQIGSAMPGLIGVVRNVTFLVIALGYLGYLSIYALGIVIAAGLLSFLVHHLCWQRVSVIFKLLAKQREISGGIGRNLVDGLKQLKLSRRQREQLEATALKNQREINSLQQRSALLFGISGSLYTAWIYSLPLLLLIGASMGILGPNVGFTAPLLALFVLAPLIAVMQGFQTNAQANFALGRVRELTDQLERDSEAQRAAHARIPQDREIRTLQARGVTYTYEREGQPYLVIGPIDVTLHRGEALFISGGNGSGKTTAGKVLCGLYTPGSGEVLIDGVRLEDTNRHEYRDHVAALFNDFSLFESLSDSEYDHAATATPPEMLERTRLSHLVKRNESLLMQAEHFSTGERRRVALLLMLMESSQILLFDEFAAEQDPEHKTWFYDELVPWLKRNGKIVVAITHDTRYFDRADVTMMLDRGLPPTIHRHRAPPGAPGERVAQLQAVPAELPRVRTSAD